MRTTAFALVMSLCSVACATSTPRPASEARNSTSSNPLESLPAMSADRCAAEAIGTASDPNTGAPVAASIDPETGKPLCPSEQPKP